MAGSEQDRVKPTEQRGGTTPDETEAREKGSWVPEGAEPDLKDAATAHPQADVRPAG